MASPVSLPLEILSEVFEFLSEDRKILARCQFVSKKFYELATPILYRSIHTTWFPDSERFNQKGTSQMFKWVTLKPELAKHAHNFLEVFYVGEKYPGIYSEDALRVVSRQMTSLRRAFISGNVFLGLHILGKVSLYPQLKELGVHDSIPQMYLWPGRLTNLKTINWTVNRDNMSTFQTNHPAATVPMLNFLFNALEATCPLIETIDVILPSGRFTNSENMIYDDPVTQDHKNLFPHTVSGADGERWALSYPRAVHQDQSRPLVLRYLKHIGINENRGVQHVPTFQTLISTFVQNHGATLNSIAIPIGPQRTRECLDFILSLCKRVLNLKTLSLFQGRDSRGPVGVSKVMGGEAFISALLDDLICLQPPIESFTLFDIASPYTPGVGKLFGQLKRLKHLHLGDRNNSILQDETAEEQFQSNRVNFESYNLMSFIKELPPSLETLVLTITGSDVRFSFTDDFDTICNLGEPTFQRLCRLRSCDIITWFPGSDAMEYAYRLPRGAAHFRRLPFENNLKHRILWISRFFDQTSFFFLNRPTLAHQPMALSPDGRDFAGEDAQDIWLGGSSGNTTYSDGTRPQIRGPSWMEMRMDDIMQEPLYQKDHIN